MTMQELYDRIESSMRMDVTAKDREVVIKLLDRGQIGGMRTVPVAYVQCGIDWENGKYLVYPAESLDYTPGKKE